MQARKTAITDAARRLLIDRGILLVLRSRSCHQDRLLEINERS
jgi:hypothetical protein